MGWYLSILVCYFMAHEHLLTEHIYLHTASGDTPVLEYRRLRSPISKLVTSRRFQKWCSSGVVSAFSLREAIDFTGFSGIFQDTAVAKKYFGHRFITPRKSCIARQTRFRKAQPSRLRFFLVWRKRFPERNNLSYL